MNSCRIYLRYPQLAREGAQSHGSIYSAGRAAPRYQRYVGAPCFYAALRGTDETDGLEHQCYCSYIFRTGFSGRLLRRAGWPTIWILNPFCLNGLSGARKIFGDNVDEPPELKLERMSGNDWAYELPIAIAVDWRNARIEHQQGVFTYHGTRKEALDELAPDCLTKVEIRGDEIGDLVDHLRDAGITHYRMLQDPDSLGLDITEGALRRGLLWSRSGLARSIGNVEDENSGWPRRFASRDQGATVRLTTISSLVHLIAEVCIRTRLGLPGTH